ncbi:MAG TPA: hypothetical protein VGH28_10375 [Polyangiaceae bacterium]|jgi:hypothetical protein
MNYAGRCRPTRLTRVAVPNAIRDSITRLKVRHASTARVAILLGVGEHVVWDALTPMGSMRPETLERVQDGLRAIGEHP